MHEILQECTLIMGDLFNQKNCQIQLDLNSEEDLVQVDRDEMIQAITNLMRNSLQAMDEAYDSAPGKGSLRIVSAKVGSELQVYFEDNGIGISQDHQQKLFQGQFSTKNPEHGTGLGLGISRRFIRSSGGDIDFISSVPRQKTVFMIRMPLSAKSKGAAA
jgi:signal transduction histidine kinase